METASEGHEETAEAKLLSATSCQQPLSPLSGQSPVPSTQLKLMPRTTTQISIWRVGVPPVAPVHQPGILLSCQCGAYRHKAGTSNLNHTHRRTWGLQSGIRAFTQFAEWETVLTPPSSDTSLGQGKGCGKLGTQRSCPGNQPQSQLCPRGRGVIPRRFRENSEARSERISDT